MNGYNRCVIAGNLTRDPEIRFAPNGTAIAKFGLAVNRKFKDSSGELKEEVTFCDIDSFGKTAESVGQYLKKGHPVLLEGRLVTQSWTDKQTQQKRSKLGIVAESVTFLSNGNARDGASPPPKREKPDAADLPPGTKSAAAAPEEDDVPF